MPTFSMVIFDRSAAVRVLSRRFQHQHMDPRHGARRLRLRTVDDVRSGSDGASERTFAHGSRLPRSASIPPRLSGRRLRGRTVGKVLAGMGADAMDAKRLRWLDDRRAPSAGVLAGTATCELHAAAP